MIFEPYILVRDWNILLSVFKKFRNTINNYYFR